MSVNFKENFVGLQIFWDDDDELEFFGPAVLSGKSTSTAASCTRGKGSMHYRYPVEVSRTALSLKLTYRQNPSNWSPDWELAKGELLIDFSKRDPQQPTRIRFLPQNGGIEDILSEGEDWVFHTDQPEELTKPHRRVKVSRVLRPEQPLLRVLLLSEHGQCQVTNTHCANTLEACHILPVKIGGNDSVSNAFLLRRDIHILFDTGLLQFRNSDHSWTIRVDDSVKDKIYRDLDGQEIRVNPSSDVYLHARARLEKEAAESR